MREVEFMLTADPANKVATFKVAFITCASLFILGFINAFSLNTHDLGYMITPQSGNVVWMGINAAAGYWSLFFENLGLFFGFIAGVVFGLLTKEFFKDSPLEFYFKWTMFVLPILIYPLAMQYVVPTVISLIILGFACGVALEFFRKLYHLEVNNAMVTGNVRFLGLHLAGAYIKSNKKEIITFWLFFLSVLLFAGGAFVYTKLAQIDYIMGLQGSGFIIGLGDHSVRMFRHTLGFGEYRIDVVSSNIARFAGLLAACIIPYFFCPKNDIKEKK